MRKAVLYILFVCLLGATAARSQVAGAADPGAETRKWVAASIEAMGGEARLRGLKSLTWKAIGHRYMREQSERPEGPWLLDYFQIVQTRDLERMRLREDREGRGCNSTPCWKSAEWSKSALVFSDGIAAAEKEGKFFPAGADAARGATESLVLAPEHVLLEALHAGDLHAEAAVTLHGFQHHVVSFRHEKSPIRIYLNSYTWLPTAVEITRPIPDSVFWNPWGDVTTRIVWSFWQLEPGGLHYPRQWNAEEGGEPDWTLTINELAVNPPLNEEMFSIPADVASAARQRRRAIDDWPLGRPGNPEVEIAPGVIQIPGVWNVEEIKQVGGIVIVEGPISNGYSAKVIEDAQRRFPGTSVKAVITTSDAWPHIGGLREYAARGITIYALDLNLPILERLFRAPHTMLPDALALHPRQPDLRLVAKKTVIGNGANRLEIYPCRTQTGERQMFVYLPAQKLLYTSDLFQRDRTGEFSLPQTISEAVDVVHREGLEVEKAFGMHLAPTLWSEIANSAAKQEETTPTSTPK